MFLPSLLLVGGALAADGPVVDPSTVTPDEPAAMPSSEPTPDPTAPADEVPAPAPALSDAEKDEKIRSLEERLAALEGRVEQVEVPAERPAPQIFPGLMNPSISFNGLFIAGSQWDDGKLSAPHVGGEAGEVAFDGAGETYGTGLNVHEMELQIQSNVDPYFKANVVLAFPGTEGVEVEEGLVTITAVPRTLINIGKIKEPFGRENVTHTHALLTIDKSLIGQRVFGGEGLNDVTVNAAVLLPTPWFSEITVGVDRGTNEVVGGSGKPFGFHEMLHWKNMFDLTYNTSLEIGVSGMTGPNAFDDRSWVGGVDVTLKTHGRGRHQDNKLIWQNEFLYMSRGGADTDARLGGLYSTIEGALSKRFWLGGRFDYVGLPEPVEGGHTIGATGIFVVTPTEFSAFRIQYQHQWAPDGHHVDSVVGQLNFTIGVHPAHSY